MFVDSHCHIDFPDLAAREDEVLANMAANRVGTALCISVTLEAFPRVLGLAERHAQLWASVGVHPDNDGCEEPDVARLLALADHPKVVAIGETGLDYYWQKDEPEWQRERFRTHIRAARQCGKPLIIHTRSAAEDTLRLMREEGAGEAGGVMHCFTESWEVAEAALELGFYISFSGIVTFRNAKALKEVACRVPLERLLIETDAPYLAPVPHRGKINEPAWVVHVAEEIARLRDEPLEHIARATTDNFFRLFRHVTRPA
ncbi:MULTISPECIES: TatD family hydrolase [unclassified Thauera]|uniref:TatD family hydrolase n=1 Tax=unclassified Thauera TaxID=2609274 RepID=UPI0002CE0FB0|nr:MULTISPECIES: TatD family hydrolase [unclassified Thauera]ENO92257.1 hydrolase, TatD family protein [Thauera sp. 28]WBL62483.1 TatD family hydrolase [Thauera sp. WB-2]HNR61121.1 TatD family hydrolase [Thauera sp.]HNS93198.1 TatD family hydrolase [Thauera sp.]HRK10623.1 TatD family hydrolase [Thauera sp.]